MGALKVFVIAGEASGDKLGAALMAGLQDLSPGVSFDGVGGEQMQARGLVSRFPMDELSVMGLAEVLPRYFDLKRRIRETAEAVIEARPDVLISIDSPDFCLRVAKIVKAAVDIPTVHYVAPSVWAWRPGRADKMARVIDHVLSLLPFEPPYMQDAGMSCDFVGHPVVTDPPADPGEVAALRGDHAGPVLGILPGSRRGEVTRLAPVFGETLARLDWPDAKVIVPVAPGLEPLVRDLTADWAVTPQLVTSADGLRKQSVMAACDLALAASGTVSLELAQAETPMVIAYDMAWLSRQIISRMVKIDTVTLVNLVSETRTVPEFIGKACRADLIAPALQGLRADPAAQTDAMALTMERLGAGGTPPGLRAAQSVLSFLERRVRS